MCFSKAISFLQLCAIAFNGGCFLVLLSVNYNFKWLHIFFLFYCLQHSFIKMFKAVGEHFHFPSEKLRNILSIPYWPLYPILSFNMKTKRHFHKNQFVSIKLEFLLCTLKTWMTEKIIRDYFFLYLTVVISTAELALFDRKNLQHKKRDLNYWWPQPRE